MVPKITTVSYTHLEVRDTSLRVPHGESGKVVDVKVFTRENGDELQPGVNKLVRVYICLLYTSSLKNDVM